MASDPQSTKQSELRRALRDLNEGMPSLFGMDSSRPALVGELLKARDADRPRKTGAPARRRPDRPRSTAHLVLVQ